MQPVVDRGGLAFAWNDLGIDLGKIFFYRLVDKDDLFILVGTDLADIGVAEEFGENRDKLMLAARDVALMFAQSLLRHFEPIEARHQGVAQLFA